MTSILTLHTKLAPGADVAIHARLVLPYELREKCRLRAVLSNGREAAVYTPRGTVLRDGDVLVGEDPSIAVQVVAAGEAVYKVTCADAHALLRCAFHLGNRHTQAQLGDGYLRIRADAVLKEMLLGLGATVEDETAPFEPEAGAYGGGHHHGHDHAHPLAPIPARQKIHRPSDIAPASGATMPVAGADR
jgi:urease accessory protein